VRGLYFHSRGELFPAAQGLTILRPPASAFTRLYSRLVIRGEPPPKLTVGTCLGAVIGALRRHSQPCGSCGSTSVWCSLHCVLCRHLNRGMNRRCVARTVTIKSAPELFCRLAESGASAFAPCSTTCAISTKTPLCSEKSPSIAWVGLPGSRKIPHLDALGAIALLRLATPELAAKLRDTDSR